VAASTVAASSLAAVASAAAAARQASAGRGPGGPGGAGGASSASSASVAPAESVLRIGSVLDNRYTLIEELGGGGMGTVYKARDRNREDFRDRQPFIALKVLGEDFKRHPDARMALQRETVRAQNLAHPNIITVYDFDYDGPHAYMTMELLEGQPLDAVLQGAEFAATTPQRRWQIVRSIGAGLAYAHEKGVVHSDLKPGNIFMCKNGVVKVMDFGIARPLRAVADQADTTLFDAAERIGGLTPAYASLEQWNRAPPDPRDDIYAFACVVYILFSSRHPFARASAKSAFETKMAPQRIDSLSRRQWDALRRGLALERKDRLGSIEEFLRLFAPQTRLQKYRLWISAVSAAAVSLLLYFAASSYREYAQDQAMNAMLWPAVGPPAQPLTTEQQREVEDVLYLANESLTQARHARNTDDFSSIMLKGANNVHEMLTTVRTMDPANSRALKMTGEAAEAYADLARTQIAASRLDDAYQMVLEGQKFAHTRSLLRLRQDICSRSPPICTP
jgi:serine/threonine protein kinase